MDYQLNVCKKFTAQIGKLNSVNQKHIKSGDLAQCYPFSVKRNTIAVRKIENNKAVGPYVRVDVESLRSNSLIMNEIKQARAQIKASRRKGNLSIWFYSIESFVSATEKNGDKHYDLNLPIMVVIEDYENKQDLIGEINIMAVHDLDLSVAQSDLIREILSEGIDDLFKDFCLPKNEAPKVKKKLLRQLDEYLTSYKDILISEDELSLSGEELAFSDDDLFISTKESPLKERVLALL
jgi:hypothetical protein